MKQIAKLEELFEERNDVYQNQTSLIFDYIKDNVIVGIVNFLELQVENDEDCIKWEEIIIHNYILTIIAFVFHPPGSVYTDAEGTKVTVPEDNSDHFKRVIKVGIPLEIAITGSSDDIVDFFKTMQESQNNDDHIFQASADSPFVPDNNANAEFNLDTLTDDQRAQLQLHYVKGKAN